MAERPANAVNVGELSEQRAFSGVWNSSWRVLTPAMIGPGGLGVNQVRLPPGCTTCPAHYHLREHEAYYVLSGRGVLRDGLVDVGPGDCVSCPAGSCVAHQIANPHDEQLVHLALGIDDPHEVAASGASAPCRRRRTSRASRSSRGSSR